MHHMQSAPGDWEAREAARRMRVGETIRIGRLNAGLTQAEFAEELARTTWAEKTNQSKVSQWERAITRPSVAMWPEIERVLGLRVGVLALAYFGNVYSAVIDGFDLPVPVLALWSHLTSDEQVETGPLVEGLLRAVIGRRPGLRVA